VIQIAYVKVDDGENLEKAIKRFKRMVEKRTFREAVNYSKSEEEEPGAQVAQETSQDSGFQSLLEKTVHQIELAGHSPGVVFFAPVAVWCSLLRADIVHP